MDADYFLMLFGGSFLGVVVLAVLVGIGIEMYDRRNRLG